MFRWLLILFLASFATAISAHEVGQSYLELRVEGNELKGQWHASLRDLEVQAGLDANQDDSVTWGEIEKARERIEATLLDSLQISRAGKPLKVAMREFELEDRAAGMYLVARWFAPLEGSGPIAIRYNFMFDFDARHLAFVSIDRDGKPDLRLLTADSRDIRLDGPPAATFGTFVRHGMFHIWEGIDHILFLLAMLLPAVLIGAGEDRGWKRTTLRVVKIVTAFTLAHSVTLALASLNIARLPSRFVETTIAISVAIAAINNIKPLWRERGAVIAFAFGLVHGLGFASALAELLQTGGSLLMTLAAFNLGVELGQLAIVAVFLLLAFKLRDSKFYQVGVVQFGSMAICGVAVIWVVERLFSIAIFAQIHLPWIG